MTDSDLLLGFYPVGFEINVDLFANNEWSGIGQIHNDRQHIGIVELAWIARIDPAWANDAGDGRNPSVKVTAAKRGSSNHHTLPDPDFSEILLIHFGAHAQRREANPKP